MNTETKRKVIRKLKGDYKDIIPHLKDILDECQNFFGGKETGQIEHNVFEIAEHLGIKIEDLENEKQ